MENLKHYRMTVKEYGSSDEETFSIKNIDDLYDTFDRINKQCREIVSVETEEIYNDIRSFKVVVVAPMTKDGKTKLSEIEIIHYHLRRDKYEGI